MSYQPNDTKISESYRSKDMKEPKLTRCNYCENLTMSKLGTIYICSECNHDRRKSKIETANNIKESRIKLIQSQDFKLKRESIIKEYTNLNDNCYLERDIKKFIRLLKEEIKHGVERNNILPLDWCFDRIDKLTGFEE